MSLLVGLRTYLCFLLKINMPALEPAPCWQQCSQLRDLLPKTTDYVIGITDGDFIPRGESRHAGRYVNVTSHSSDTLFVPTDRQAAAVAWEPQFDWLHYKTFSGCTIAQIVSRRLFIADVTGSMPVAEYRRQSGSGVRYPMTSSFLA